ncbi:unnamed protein product [Gordionus sp. m RMFG-2023]
MRTKPVGSVGSRPMAEIHGTRRDEEDEQEPEHHQREAHVDQMVWPVVDLTTENETPNEVAAENNLTRREVTEDTAAERMGNSQGVMETEELRDLAVVLDDVEGFDDELGGWLDVMINESE